MEIHAQQTHDREGEHSPREAEGAALALKDAASQARSTVGHGADHLLHVAFEARDILQREVAELRAANLAIRKTGSGFVLFGGLAGAAAGVTFCTIVALLTRFDFHQTAAGLLAYATPHVMRFYL